MKTQGSAWTLGGRASKQAEHLSNEQVEIFRRLLVARRKATLEEIQRLRREIGEDDERASDEPTKFRHVDEIDHQMQSQIIDREQQILDAIDAALQRIKDGTYGVCTVTNRPIAIGRLRAIPYAEVCQEAEVVLEEEGK